ncbi:MAG TPA: hypothetical protein GXX36_02685 [Clostridiaceae bacterium]|nr:hypothetical protein [Clostridiaceae bacterium]
MGLNERIITVKRRNTVVLSVLAALQVIMLLITKFILDSFRSELNFEDIINNIVIAVLAVCFILTDIYFYVKRIYRVGCLPCDTPIKCVVEDLVFFSHTDDGVRRYKVYPIVRNTETGQLMFTYDNYCLGSYTTRHSSINNALISARIYRKDNSVVKTGDTVHVYILKPVTVQVQIDEGRNIVKLNRAKYRFLHENENYKADVFNELHFFEGLIDVECGEIEN